LALLPLLLTFALLVLSGTGHHQLHLLHSNQHSKVYTVYYTPVTAYRIYFIASTVAATALLLDSPACWWHQSQQLCFLLASYTFNK
jgi:hypothetical protein